jgi:hypothetical protein
MSDGGVTIIIPWQWLPTRMIKGLNFVQHEDEARGDSHMFLSLRIPLGGIAGWAFCPEPLGSTSLAETRLWPVRLEKPPRRRGSLNPRRRVDGR